ncbi:MAG: hypothetical protein Q9160_001737 [Pyrenula sp. 1 TL-2023]
MQSPILSLLSTCLPYSLPIYRRIQFLESHPNPEHARIIIFPPLPSVPIPNDASPESIAKTPPFIVASVDLSRGQETQIWMFSSLELPDIEALNSFPNNDGQKFREVVRQQMNEIFSIVYNELVPKLPDLAPESYRHKRLGKPLPYSRSRVLIGTLHQNLRALIPTHTVVRIDSPYMKYIFPMASFSEPVTLPPQYEFCDLQRSHLDAVISRTEIPRSIPTLLSMYSGGIVHDSHPNPIAWGFLGFDGSLSTLHTEPEHRGKGLGVQMSRHLFQDQGAVFSSGTDWAHADVGEDNQQSRRVMEKIGGRVMWQNCWVEVELAKLFEDPNQ